MTCTATSANVWTREEKRAIEEHNSRKGVQPVKFGRGYFVLVRRAVDRGHKLNYRWVGPRRVLSELSPLVFEVEDLVSVQTEHVHARRLIEYRADADYQTVDPPLVALAEHSTTTYQVAVGIRAIREVFGEITVQVEWDGLLDDEDLSWKPL